MQNTAFRTENIKKRATQPVFLFSDIQSPHLWNKNPAGIPAKNHRKQLFMQGFSGKSFDFLIPIQIPHLNSTARQKNLFFAGKRPKMKEGNTRYLRFESRT